MLGVVIWIGGVAWQAHVLAPLARRGDARVFAEAARRARPVTWTAVGLVVLTGFYNVTRLGSLQAVMDSGAGLALAGKFILVIAAVTIAAQRDFAHVPRLARAIAGTESVDVTTILKTITWLDRIIVVFAIAIVYLGLFVSRGH